MRATIVGRHLRPYKLSRSASARTSTPGSRAHLSSSNPESSVSISKAPSSAIRSARTRPAAYSRARSSPAETGRRSVARRATRARRSATALEQQVEALRRMAADSHTWLTLPGFVALDARRRLDAVDLVEHQDLRQIGRRRSRPARD